MPFRTVEMRVGGYHLRDGDDDEFCWQDAVTELAAAASERGGIFPLRVDKVSITVNAESCPELLEEDVRLASLEYLEGAVGPTPRQYTDGQRELIVLLQRLDTKYPDLNGPGRPELLHELHRLMVSEP